MQTTYYIFLNNKVVHRDGLVPPVPCSEKEFDAILAHNESVGIEKVAMDRQAYAIDLPEGALLPQDYTATPLRRLLGLIGDNHFRNWGRASHLLHWLRTSRFCGSCGKPTNAHPTETARYCRHCEILLYPQISPCIIVLVHRGSEMLLARSPRFPGNMYSTLAGFIEPGESAEEALHREIYEEVRLRVDQVTYFDSQPWPFPGQLMLGFFARYHSGELIIDNDEICDAHWYSATNLPQIPSPETIAGQLIRTFLDKL